MTEITYEIKEQIGILGINSRNWTKEVNLISWNGGTPKYDIRDWDPTHQRMSKGVTLSEEEFSNLKKIILGQPVDLGGDDVDEDKII